MNSFIKTDIEIELMRKSGKILASVLEQVQNKAVAGVSTLELDLFAEQLIREAGAVPSFKGYKGFPGTLCISIDEEAVHGIPEDDIILQEGQIITIDGGACFEGFHTDSATTFGVGVINPAAERFIESVRQTLYQSIKLVKPGARIGEISNFIDSKTNKDGYFVIRELIGHGIGRSLHEPPQVPNFGKPSSGQVIVPGMTFCIEPIIGHSTRLIDTLDDNWTIVTRDGSLACQQEHTILVTQTGFEILTLRDNEFFI
jgi:methionyl aminopeptidase